MKKFLFLFISALSFLLASTHSASPVALMETCSCSAPDGTCSVNLTCRGGCLRYCGNAGDCWAECSDPTGMSGKAHTKETKTESVARAEIMRKLNTVCGFVTATPHPFAQNGYSSADILGFVSPAYSGKDVESLRKLPSMFLLGEEFYLTSKTPCP
jgi:hypothetical protein